LLAKRRTVMLVGLTYLNTRSKTHVSVLRFAAFLPAICCWNTFVLINGFPSGVMGPIFPSILILPFLCSELIPRLKIVNYSFIEIMWVGIA
jgi:hypothetical protein